MIEKIIIKEVKTKKQIRKKDLTFYLINYLIYLIYLISI